MHAHRTRAGSGLTGGCQRGAVCCVARATPAKVHDCHCQMCQRALGNLFATLVPVPKSRLEWTGEPGSCRSSSLATRGFCARCGTPLSFACDDSKWICLTLGSLDGPAAVRPEVPYGVKSQVPWPEVRVKPRACARAPAHAPRGTR